MRIRSFGQSRTVGISAALLVAFPHFCLGQGTR